MEQRFYDAVEESPVIAAVKDMEGLKKCGALEDIKVVFILFGDICTIKDIVAQVKASGQIAMVHMDLITGLSSKDVAVDFIKNNTQADGIITTKPALIKRGKELSLFTILRFFIIDSMALENIGKQQYAIQPDFIEVLPGVMPKIIKDICAISKIPIIAGGLIRDKEDVVGALSAGAISVSTTNQTVWFM
ncbi:MAG: glycerol-3-phosphate responsive antiterminator [Lachnospiraceae bacterium]